MAARSRKQERKRQRRKKRIIGASVITSIVLAGLGGVGFYAYNNLQSKISTVDTTQYIQKPRPTKATVPNPEDPFSGALNILLIGSDERNPEDNSATTGMRSDTVMIAHISEDRQRAEIVSIPRDSWVDIPSCMLPNGEETPPTTAKFNASFALGGQGGDVSAAVACTIQTVEDLTGVYIDDYVVVNFSGFEGMVDALGGVEFNVEEDIIDPSFSNTKILAGKQTFDGKTALRYARVRKAIGMDGSDISRIGRQQELLQAIVKKAKTKMTDPTAMYKLAGKGLESMTTSPELGNLNSMAGFAWSIKEADVEFLTVPIADRGDGANVVWTSKADVLWEMLIEDEPVTKEGLEKLPVTASTEAPEGFSSTLPSTKMNSYETNTTKDSKVGTRTNSKGYSY